MVLIGTLLGIVTALAKISKIAPLRWLANIYIEIFRGTPMLVQIMLGFGLMGSLSLPTFQVGILQLRFGALDSRDNCNLTEFGGLYGGNCSGWN